MKIITTKVHGMLDYLVGVALLLAPTIFGFAEVGGAAVTVPTVLGIGLILYALLTRFELGLIKVLPMSAHLMIDYLAGIFLALSPWIFGFADNAANVWVPHLVVGIVILIAAAMTEKAPRSVRA